jgi:glycine cleavage system aminomethyltransferase T
MVNEHGKVAIEGLTLRLGEDTYLFTQSGAQSWLPAVCRQTAFDVRFEDVTADYTCYALQGPRSLDVLEALTGERFRDLRFSRWRTTRILGEDVIVSRQGVTGEIGYEFLMRTDTGKAHELWRTIRRVGQDFGLRELGLKAQMIGHTETGIATVIRDFLPARMHDAQQVRKFARLWMSQEELAAFEPYLMEHFCSPAELGWEHMIDLAGHDFYGRSALLREAESGGPARRFVGLMWNSDDMADLYAALFRDATSAPPPDLPYGQFRLCFHKILHEEELVGWASGATYSPNLRRMISLARVRKDLAAPGTDLIVVWGGFSDEPSMRIRARVHPLPFIRQHRKDDLTHRA